MMLKDKVVVVAGVGSGLGRSVALASAREGADVVLAARTAARLDDVADAAAAENLAATAKDAFGRVDALVYNALAMPPIKELGVVSLDTLGPGFDANVVAALRLTRLVTPLLEEAGGAAVFVNSMVVRFSQAAMGPY